MINDIKVDNASNTCKVGEKYQIVIPKKIRDQLNIKKNEKLAICIIDNAIVMLPVPSKVEDLAGMGKGLYKDDYVEKIRNEWD